MRTITLLCLALVAAFGFAEQAKTTSKPISKRTNTSITCADGKELKACNSFRELVAANDKVVVAAITNTTPNLFGKETYVCFRPDEDFFVLISFVLPTKSGWGKPEGKHSFEQWGASYCSGYKNGIPDLGPESINTFGSWTSAFGGTFDAGDARYSGSTEDGEYTSIDETSFIATHNYKNISNEDATYQIVVQRSTGRFTEMYEFPLDKQRLRTDHSGRCLRYELR